MEKAIGTIGCLAIAAITTLFGGCAAVVSRYDPHDHNPYERVRVTHNVLDVTVVAGGRFGSARSARDYSERSRDHSSRGHDGRGRRNSFGGNRCD